MRDRPNVLYLHSHDTGRFVQPYGHAIATPSLQRLAEEGVLFRQAFCAAPTCSASRASLLTGRYAHSCGMLGLAHRGFSLDDYGHHVVHTLRRAGYRSTLIGEQHVSKDPAAIGYDTVHRVEGRSADAVADLAVAELGQATEPFFLSVGFHETHRDFPPVSEADARYQPVPAHLPDTPEVRRDVAAFAASAADLDRGIGRILDALDDDGLAERTLVVCTTDHGLPFPGAKATLADRGIGVMLILRGPGGFGGGAVCDALVSQVDLFPTICDVAGVESPDWLQGRSLVPLVRGEVDAVRDAVFAEATYHAAYEPQRAIRTERWKYVRRFHDRPAPTLVNVDDGPTKELLVEHGWRGRPEARAELYDLVFDPGEHVNVVDRPELAPVRDELARRLDLWMRHTDDPLRDGPVELPEGCEANEPWQLSASEPTHRGQAGSAMARIHGVDR